MRILVIGAGSVGGYFGARLAHAGRDVTFLVRERRAAQLQASGLRITEPNGSFTIQPAFLQTGQLRETFDLILLATKAYSLDAAMEDFAPAVGDNTMVLPLLNGMRHLDALRARFGDAKILGGSTRISSDLDADGHVLSMDRALQNIYFGELDGNLSPRIRAVDAAISHAGFETCLEPDIVAFMWNKWTMLSALASITCLLRGSIGAVAAVPGGAETERALLAESIAIAIANGYPPPPAFVESITARLTEQGSDLTASMYRDMVRGYPVEADHILGDLLARGEAHRIASPLLRAAYVQLCVYQAQHSNGDQRSNQDQRNAV